MVQVNHATARTVGEAVRLDSGARFPKRQACHVYRPKGTTPLVASTNMARARSSSDMEEDACHPDIDTTDCSFSRPQNCEWRMRWTSNPESHCPRVPRLSSHQKWRVGALWLYRDTTRDADIPPPLLEIPPALFSRHEGGSMSPRHRHLLTAYSRSQNCEWRIDGPAILNRNAESNIDAMPVSHGMPSQARSNESAGDQASIISRIYNWFSLTSGLYRHEQPRYIPD